MNWHITLVILDAQIKSYSYLVAYYAKFMQRLVPETGCISNSNEEVYKPLYTLLTFLLNREMSKHIVILKALATLMHRHVHLYSVPCEQATQGSEEVSDRIEIAIAPRRALQTVGLPLYLLWDPNKLNNIRVIKTFANYFPLPPVYLGTKSGKRLHNLKPKVYFN